VQEKRLSARAIATLSRPGRHADGGGLYLVISNRDGFARRSWLYLFTWQGKLRAMGLGPYPLISLAEARGKRDKWRTVLVSGRNPIEVRRTPASKTVPTFGEFAAAFLEAKAPQWRNAKHRAQWRTTVEVYAKSLRDTPVDTIDTAAVLSVLKPVWQRIPETASRLRARIEAILDAAKAQEHRSGENPARWRGHLDHLLAKRQTLARKHHAAMPYSDMAGFITTLRKKQNVSTAAIALEFLILTAARTGEVLGARWSEIDLSARVWTVPSDRMKGGREHRVPLSDRAAEIIEEVAATKTSEFVFPGRRSSPLSNMAITMVLRRMKAGNVTAHGFRSSFRDWAGNETNFARELAEAALAHVIGDKAEQAYRRGDALERRRGLMATWAAFVEPQHKAATNVVAITRA
jgi:integrase